MYGDWIIAKGTALGERHRVEGGVCQDAHNLYFDESSGYGIAVISDGAGSAANSDKGSKFIVDGAVKLLKSKLTLIGFNDFVKLKNDDILLFFSGAFKDLRESIESYADSSGYAVESLAATVIVVLFSKEIIVCSHIGDGRAAFQNMEGEWLPMLEPYKGEMANETIFLTSRLGDSLKPFIRTRIIKGQVQSFTLMSDGCENHTFKLAHYNEELQKYEKLNRPFAGFFNPNVDVLRKLSMSGFRASEIDKLWVKYLESGNASFIEEPDDKTLILATLAKV